MEICQNLLNNKKPSGIDNQKVNFFSLDEASIHTR